MMFLSRAESSYLHQHLSVVRHVTLYPEGTGVLRIHLLPCKKARRNVPFVALLNGQDILPLSVSWAILLAGLMDALQPFEGKEITEDESKRGQESMQKLVDKYIKQVDTAREAKEKEVLEV